MAENSGDVDAARALDVLESGDTIAVSTWRKWRREQKKRQEEVKRERER